jgi:6-phosphofructokinase
VTTTLVRTYGVETIYGIQYGYKGFYSHPWKRLDLDVVRDIHKSGGTMLGTSRGGFDLDKSAPDPSAPLARAGLVRALAGARAQLRILAGGLAERRTAHLLMVVDMG